METLIVILCTLILVSYVYLIIVAHKSKTIHENSYQVGVALADYINQKANDINEITIAQGEADVKKSLAEANLTQAQADLISSDIKNREISLL